MTANVLVAGIGNIFLGDDGFGCEVARRLAARTLPDGVVVCDYGIRGMDLAYQLLEPYDAIIFIDALPRGEEPGTLCLLEPDIPRGEATVDTHGMDPLSVLLFAQSLGMQPTRTYVIGCEPAVVKNPDEDDEIWMELSPPVTAALDGAVEMIETLLAQIDADPRAVSDEQGFPVGTGSGAPSESSATAPSSNLYGNHS